MAFNPFQSFRKHQKGVFAGLTLLAMGTFIFSFGKGDFFEMLTNWSGRSRGGAPAVATMYGKDVDSETVANTQRKRALAERYMDLTMRLAQIQFGELIRDQKDKVEPDLKQLIEQFSQIENFAGMGQMQVEQYYGYLGQIGQRISQMRPMIDAGTAPNKQDQLTLMANFSELTRQKRERLERDAAAQQQRRPTEGFFGGNARSTEDTLDFLIWKHQADQLGIRVDREDVKEAVKFESLDQELKPERVKFRYEQMVNDYGSTFTPDSIYEALIDELRVRAAKTAVTGIGAGRLTRDKMPVLPTPGECFDWFKDYRTQVTAGLIEVPVASFLDKVTATPSEADLKKLYDQYKTMEPAPFIERPGFKIPRLVKVEWIAVDPNSEFYTKKAQSFAPILQAFRQIGAFAASDESTAVLGSVVGLTNVTHNLPYHDQYERYLAEAPTWGNNFAMGLRSGIHDSSVVRPESLAILAGAAVGAAMTDAGPFSAALALESRVVLRECRDRARIGASLVLGAALEPAPFGIDALAIGLVPEPVTESFLRPLFVRDLDEKLKKKLVSNDESTFRAELFKRATTQDANNVQAYINEFVHERKLERGGMATARERFAIPSDPGVAPIKALVDRLEAQQNRGPVDPGNEGLTQLLADMPENRFDPSAKPRLYQPQDLPGENKTYMVWRSEDKEPAVQTFEKARPQVEAAWKLGEARKLAAKSAETIAAEAKGADAAKLRDLATRTSSRLLIELPAMAQLNKKQNLVGSGPTQYEGAQIPRDRILYPGAMVKDVLDLREKEPGFAIVTSDQPKSAYYVASLMKKDVPTIAEFAMTYRDSMIDPQFRDPLLAMCVRVKQTEYRKKLIEDLRKDAKLQVKETKAKVDEESE